MNPADLSPLDYAVWQWNGPHPSRAEVYAQLRLEQKSEDATRLKARRERWRAKFPGSTCSDRIADELAWLDEAFSR